MTAPDPRLNAGDYLPGDVEEGPVSLPQRVLDHVWADGKTTRQAINSAAHASSSQAGVAAVKYGPAAPPAARPFQVGDRVRITDHNRHRVNPDAQYVFEGIVSRIDPASAPESEYVFGPYLWIDTEPFRDSAGGTNTATFCPLTDDLTAAADSELSRSIELLEPAPTDTSDGAVTDHAPAPSEAPRPFKDKDRVYVSHPAPWGGRVGTVVRDGADSLGRVRVLLDGDDDGTGLNWVAIEAEYLILSFEVADILGDTTPDHGPLAASLSDRTLAKVLSRPAHVPSIVMLDRDAAAQRLAGAAEDMLKADEDSQRLHNRGPVRVALPRLRQALADYRETTR